MTRTVNLYDETPVPALGQGTWRMGEDARLRQQEIAALRAGIEQGMTLIDTAEMYGDGATETLLGEAMAGLRDQVFLVSKVYPQNAGRGRIERACEASLQPSEDRPPRSLPAALARRVPLAETVEGMEALVAAGKIRALGRQQSRPWRHGGAVPRRRRGLRDQPDPLQCHRTRGGIRPPHAAKGTPHSVHGVQPGRPGSSTQIRRSYDSRSTTRRDGISGRPGLGPARSDGHRHSESEQRRAHRRQPTRPGPEAHR